MTITFDCPKCGQMCAFKSRYAGRRARCTVCSQIFIIPSESGQTPQKIEHAGDKPVPGFYRAVFVKNWEIFALSSNIVPLVFLAALAGFRFFLAHVDYSFTVGAFRVQLPIGWIVIIITWGLQLHYYMEVIASAAFNIIELPEIGIDDWVDFFLSIIRSIYLFVVAFLLPEMPFLFLISILKEKGITSPLILLPVVLAGAFLFPVILLLFSTTGDLWRVLRIDHILRPVLSAFLPYFASAAFIGLVLITQYLTFYFYQVQDKSVILIAFHFVVYIAAALLWLPAMRSIGLFYRHYRCHIRWL